MTTRSADANEIRDKVREGYGRVAEQATGCCGGAPPEAASIARRIGYTEDQLGAVPAGANLGVGCGNPTALASLRPGEVVLDLGSGAGFDALLAAREVGPRGRVIGVDMTDAMLEKARRHAAQAGLAQVEFRKGTIEALPVEDASIDVVISNCVINLSPEKEQVFREVHRVLRPGGRMLISDLVLERPLPREVAESVEAYIGCVAGASLREAYLETIRKAGFARVEVVGAQRFGEVMPADAPEVRDAAERYGVSGDAARLALDAVTSLKVRAVKAGD